jgi:capsular exopolysaccharide synthesis family protein
MGRMQDALKKAAEERERKRLAEGGHPAPPESGPVAFDFSRPDEEAAVVTRALERKRVAGRATPVVAEAARPSTDERLVVFHAPSDERAEEFRKIRANILSLDPVPRTMLVTSGASNEGKSLTAANLALTLLETGQSEVLLVDANLRYPELADILAIPPGPGLGDVLGGDAEKIASAIVATSIPGLFLLPAGAGGIAAARQLKPAVLKRVLDCVRGRFSFVVVDSPAASDYADAVLMSTDVDGVLVVVRVGSGKRSATARAVEDLESSKARVLGTVVLTGT